MNFLAVIAAVNQMEVDGVIGKYAVGGAVGATFYLEPAATFDVDIFVTFAQEPGSLLLNPQPIYSYLAARGHRMEGEYAVISGTPVQFLPAAGPLAEEGLEQAVVHLVGGVQARVFTAEHLAAMALQTGRSKDKARLLQFIEDGVLDSEKFELLLSRHDLLTKWRQFERQFLEP